jgi:TctA family transporter
MQPLITYLPILLIGVGYGFLFGLIPIAGAQVALIALFPYAEHFMGDPYSMVVMTTAVVVSATIGDMFSSVVMNIPGGGGSAATMIDGFPMARRGEATRALSAGLFSASSNSLLWGILCIVMLPYYVKIVYLFGLPEMLMFCVFSFACICFTNNQYWFRGIVALLLGMWAGTIGEHPTEVGAYRYTFGWEYLKSGLQLAPVMAGVMALPELIEGLKGKVQITKKVSNNWIQIKQGFSDWWKHRWDSFKGGVIGGVIGALPGVGGSIVDFVSYSLVAMKLKKDDKYKFGEGNVRGVIAPEGSNLAQKATAYVPTVLFGIPGAPFEVLVIALLAYVGLNVGSPRLLGDQDFFNALSFGYMASLFVTFFLALLFIRWATLICRVPFRLWGPLIFAVITWACTRYTQGWEDYAVLLIMMAVGMSLRYLKLNRIAFVIGFVLSAKILKLYGAFLQIYGTDIWVIFTRPMFVILLLGTLSAVIYGLVFKRSTINYY